MSNDNQILTHEFESPEVLIQLKRIKHKNHDDFTKVYRHSYFEVRFFYKGGGKNLNGFKICFHWLEIMIFPAFDIM